MTDPSTIYDSPRTPVEEHHWRQNVLEGLRKIRAGLERVEKRLDVAETEARKLRHYLDTQHHPETDR